MLCLLACLAILLRVNGASIFGLTDDLFVDEIVPYLLTLDLQSLSQTTSSIESTLTHIFVQRDSMFTLSNSLEATSGTIELKSSK